MEVTVFQGPFLSKIYQELSLCRGRSGGWQGYSEHKSASLSFLTGDSLAGGTRIPTHAVWGPAWNPGRSQWALTEHLLPVWGVFSLEEEVAYSACGEKKGEKLLVTKKDRMGTLSWLLSKFLVSPFYACDKPGLPWSLKLGVAMKLTLEWNVSRMKMLSFQWK